MIYDKLSNLKAYLGFCKNLDTALNYLASHDLNSLPMGKTVVDGENVFLTVMTESYQEETDFGTVSCKSLVSCTMGVGSFIICMAGEPHKPGVAAEEDIFLKKCVVKVHI